jgi:hypothetical protein
VKLTAKGRVTIPVSILQEVLGVADDFTTTVVSYDRAMGLITLIGYSEEPIKGLTYSFKESDKMEDLHITLEGVREQLCQK